MSDRNRPPPNDQRGKGRSGGEQQRGGPSAPPPAHPRGGEIPLPREYFPTIPPPILPPIFPPDEVDFSDVPASTTHAPTSHLVEYLQQSTGAAPQHAQPPSAHDLSPEDIMRKQIKAMMDGALPPLSQRIVKCALGDGYGCVAGHERCAEGLVCAPCQEVRPKYLKDQLRGLENNEAKKAENTISGLEHTRRQVQFKAAAEEGGYPCINSFNSHSYIRLDQRDGVFNCEILPWPNRICRRCWIAGRRNLAEIGRLA